MPGYEGYEMVHHDDGSVTFACRPREPGTYKITVEHDGLPLIGLPMVCVVEKYGDLRGDQSTAYSTGYDGLFLDSQTLSSALTLNLTTPGVTVVRPLSPQSSAVGPPVNETLVQKFEESGMTCDLEDVHDVQDDKDNIGLLHSPVGSPFVSDIDTECVASSPVAPLCEEIELTDDIIHTHDEQTPDKASESIEEEVGTRKSRRRNKGDQSKIVKRKSPRKTREASSFVCGEAGCGKEFPSKSKLKRHTSVHAERAFPCEVGNCRRNFKSQERLKQHQRKQHSGQSDHGGQPAPQSGHEYSDDAETKPIVCEVHNRTGCLDCAGDLGEQPCANDEGKWTSPVKHETETSQKDNETADGVDNLKDLDSGTKRSSPCICRICNKSFSDNYKLKRHSLIHSDVRPFPCSEKDCEKSFKYQCVLKQHMALVHGQGGHTCPICDKHFPIESRLARHILVHSTNRKFKCDLCEKVYKNKESLKTHLCLQNDGTSNRPRRKRGLDKSTADNKNRHVCNVCGKEYAILSKLLRHMSIHSTEKNFMCELCGKSLKTKDILTVHKREQHNNDVELLSETGNLQDGGPRRIRPRPFMCTYCGKTFRRKSHMNWHVQVHESKVRISCIHEGCTKTFPTDFKLKQHLRTVHKPETGSPVRCDRCGKQFKRRPSLAIHMKTTHSAASWQCSEPGCFSKFTTKNTMLRHVNAKHRDFECTFSCSHDNCDRKFKFKELLRQHEQSHRTERNFECTDCGKSFKTKNTLKMHSVIHSENKQHMCEVCGRYFTRKHRLRSHMARHNTQQEEAFSTLPWQ